MVVDLPTDKRHLRVENLKPVHIRGILEIQSEHSLVGWVAEDYLFELAREDSVCLVAVNRTGQILGFILLRLIMNKQNNSKTSTVFKTQTSPLRKHPDRFSTAEIYNFGIQKKLQRQGIGQFILDKTIGVLKDLAVREIWLEVRKSNTAAVEFYHKNNFREQFTRKNYYRKPLEDALVLKRRVSPVKRSNQQN